MAFKHRSFSLHIGTSRFGATKIPPSRPLPEPLRDPGLARKRLKKTRKSSLPDHFRSHYVPQTLLGTWIFIKNVHFNEQLQTSTCSRREAANFGTCQRRRNSLRNPQRRSFGKYGRGAPNEDLESGAAKKEAK